MGHTVPPMRQVVYSKIAELKKLCKGLREPDRTAAESLLLHVYQNISAISYANPMPNDVEDSMLFTMLIQEKLAQASMIDDLTLLVFSVMVRYRVNRERYADEGDIHRLLEAGR